MIIFNYETLVDPFLRDVRQFTPEFAGMKAHDRVLDVCCGTGAQVLEYGRRGIVSIGIDNSREMLKTALRKKSEQHAENVQFQLADATSLPFPDGYYDYASVSFALHDKERSIRDRVVAEMKRVVKTGGTLVFIDYQVPLPGNAWAVFARAVEYFAGRSHYRGFMDFLENGGLDGVMMKHRLREYSRVYFMSGLVAMTTAVND
jgi:ubiquinone/menaquinone biosynthesis C-methylase UbiE